MMEEAVLTRKKSRKKAPEKIPDFLVYEIVDGLPIYYRGYKDVLNKTKTFEEITMESKLQAGLKAELTMLIGFLLKQHGYQLATGELGVNISKTDKRGADLAIFKKENWSWESRFTDLPPEVVVEIDVQAEMENQTEMDYVNRKIKDYIKFGVKKIIWIFTKDRLVFVATPQFPWHTYEWDAEIEVVEGVRFCLDEIVKPA